MNGLLKPQIEHFGNDFQGRRGSVESYQLQMVDMIGNTAVDRWFQQLDQVSQSDESVSHSLEIKRIEPLYEAFVCPLTKKMMHDPVTLETGQTYERSAIEHWFKECSESGRPISCPVTRKQLESVVVKPSIALRNTIEEWAARNEITRIENAHVMITGRKSDQDVIYSLKDLQSLCANNKFNKFRVRAEGLIPLIAELLKGSEQVRLAALTTLRVIAEGDDNIKEVIGETDALRSCVKCLNRDLQKEREEAVLLLFDLSQSLALCEKIGQINGSILMLVGLTSNQSENTLVVQRAEQTIKNLERCEFNIKQMADCGRLQPLLKQLVEGGEEVQLEMASYLASLAPSDEAKFEAAVYGGRTLVGMLESGYMASREAALKCLCLLSKLERNGKVLVDADILPPLTRNLFLVGPNQLPMKLKEVSATLLANVVSSGVDIESIPIDAEGDTLTSELIIHNLLHLISNTGPAIEVKLLQVLAALLSVKSTQVVERVVLSIKSAGAAISLIQFLEAPQKDLCAISVKLLHLLCPYMGQELADGLKVTTGQLRILVQLIGNMGMTEEQVAAAGLLANLPVSDLQLTRGMLEAGVLPIAVRKLEELHKAGAVRIGVRFITSFKKGLVGILSRFASILDSESALSLMQEFNLTSLFTSILNRSGESDDVLRLSASALEKLSDFSKRLSSMSDVSDDPNCLFFFCPFLKSTPRSLGLCPLHGGICSARNSFCLIEAQAIIPLVACLDSKNVGLIEAALGALSTLLKDQVNIKEGAQILKDVDAVSPILAILQLHRTQSLQERAIWIVERMLRFPDIAQGIAIDPSANTAIVEVFRHGGQTAKKMAEKALKHLDKIPEFSVVVNRGR